MEIMQFKNMEIMQKLFDFTMGPMFGGTHKKLI